MVAVFAGWEDLGCDTLESAGFAVPDDLKAELTFTDAVGLEGSGFLAAADVVVDGGFLASEAEGGRPTSFLAAAVGLEGCAAVVLPVEGAAATLGAVLFAAALVMGLVVAVVGLDVVGAGRDVDGAVAGLVILEAAAPVFLGAVGVLGFGGAEAAGLGGPTVVLGFVALTVSVFFLGTQLDITGLVPFVTVAAEVVLVGPTGFLSGTLVWFLAIEEAADAPSGLLGGAPAVEAFDAIVAVVFLATAEETLLEDLTLFPALWGAVPGRELDPAAPAVLALGCDLFATLLGFTLGSAVTCLSLAFWAAADAAASFATSSV